MARQHMRQRPRAQKCYFCEKQILPDWKKPEVLSDFVDGRGRILGRMKTGICAKHQRLLAKAIKRARHLALLPFTTRVK